MPGSYDPLRGRCTRGREFSIGRRELLPCRAPTSLPPKELSFRPFGPHTVLVPDLTDHKTTTATPGRDARSCKRDIDKWVSKRIMPPEDHLFPLNIPQTQAAPSFPSPRHGQTLPHVPEPPESMLMTDLPGPRTSLHTYVI